MRARPEDAAVALELMGGAEYTTPEDDGKGGIEERRAPICEIRDGTLAFIGVKLTKFVANDKRGYWRDSEGAPTADALQVMRGLQNQVTQLRERLQMLTLAPSDPDMLLAVAFACADVSNMAQIIADVSGGLPLFNEAIMKPAENQSGTVTVRRDGSQVVKTGLLLTGDEVKN